MVLMGREHGTDFRLKPMVSQVGIRADHTYKVDGNIPAQLGLKALRNIRLHLQPVFKIEKIGLAQDDHGGDPRSVKGVEGEKIICRERGGRIDEEDPEIRTRQVGHGFRRPRAGERAQAGRVHEDNSALESVLGQLVAD